MIELLAVQAVTTAALAFFVIKLRRELWPMIAAAGPTHASFWIRSVDAMVLRTPQMETSKTVIRVRWLLSEELFLIRRFRVYDVAMRPRSRYYYKMWKAWLSGDDRYRCLQEKPRGLTKLYNKAIEVICYDMQDEKDRRFWRVIEITTRRRRRKHKT